MVQRYLSADEKVAQYASNNEYDTDADNKDYCESFKNANQKRTSSAQAHFAINGVLGSMCARHAVPRKFANIVNSGERFKYPLAVLDDILSEVGPKNVDIMYDVGCRFDKTLKRHFGEWDGKCAVGIFHAYAHSASCQIEYNPKYAPGFGLTDGEWSERRWSYMNGHIRTTRHMSHNHRLLVLTGALDAFKHLILL